MISSYCSGKYQEYGRTEIIQNDPNPKFRDKIKVPYNFEKNQIVKIIFFTESSFTYIFIGKV